MRTDTCLAPLSSNSRRSCSVFGSSSADSKVIEKETFARELLLQRHAIAALFTDDQKSALFNRKANSADRPADNPPHSAAGHAGAAPPVRKELSPAQQQQLNRHLRNAMKAWSLLRPEAEPFYKEDAMLNLESRLNSLTLEHSSLQQELLKQQEQQELEDGLVPPTGTTPLSFNLPVLNPRAFVLAVFAVSLSLGDDLHALLQRLQVEDALLPPRHHPKRLLLLLEAVEKSFRLEKTPAAAGPWVSRCWHRLRPFMPPAIAELSDEAVAAWLAGHLSRVIANQKRYALLPVVSPQPISATAPPVSLSPTYSSKNGSSPQDSIDARFAAFVVSRLRDPLYDMGRDCLFDSWLVKEDAIDNLILKADLADAPQALKGLAAFFQLTGANGAEVYTPEVEAAVSRLFGTLSDVGLSDWLRAVPEMFEAFLPHGEIPYTSVSPEDMATARLLLAAATKGKGNLLDFDAASPFKLLHGIPAKTVEEELRALPENPLLPSAELEKHFNVEEAARCIAPSAEGTIAGGSQTAADETLKKFKAKFGITPLEALVDDELKFVQTAGPAEWQLQDCSGGSGEHGSGSNASEAPSLAERDGASAGDGLVFAGWKWKRPSQTVRDASRGVYVRERGGVDPQLALHELRQTLLQANRMMAMTKLGNGRGLFGIGIGFGSKPKDARSSAALSAIQNLKLLDLDDARILTTPQHGQEYSAHVKIIPRPSGRGLRCNLRFLPLMYLTGLDNCRVTFAGPSSRSRWFSRSKALMRALQQLQSRKTISRATGLKIDELTAPGDAWTHWPDSWFRPIAASYEEKLRRIKARRHKTAKWSFRSNVSEIVPEECRPEFTPYTWKPPLERWAQRQKLLQLTCHNVKQLALPPPGASKLLSVSPAGSQQRHAIEEASPSLLDSGDNNGSSRDESTGG
ncbi:30s ribosomal protein [Cyclospora cayetanensis]|uniref:30s ribosomal protein n=1 Tax=Cyclospora cayetanensis TaxID=88456 RepID=A0A1D3D7V8_9EIME|nr:30s ribosomal protein [Cyclospora cayetanensis]